MFWMRKKKFSFSLSPESNSKEWGGGGISFCLFAFFCNLWPLKYLMEHADFIGSIRMDPIIYTFILIFLLACLLIYCQMIE